MPTEHSGKWVSCNKCNDKFLVPNFEEELENMASDWLDQDAIVDNQVTWVEDQPDPNKAPPKRMTPLMPTRDVPYLPQIVELPEGPADLIDIEKELKQMGLDRDGTPGLSDC